MGSTYTDRSVWDDRIQMEAAADAAFDEVRRLDDLLSNYKPDSEWSQVNRHAAEQAGEGFAGVVPAACRPAWSTAGESEGAFDITVGPADEGLGVL